MNEPNATTRQAADELRRTAHEAARDLDFSRYLRSRRRRSAATFTVAAVVLALVVVSTALLNRVETDDVSPISPPTTVPPATTTVATGIEALPVFDPGTRNWGTSTLVPLGFVDGTTAELSYPNEYDFLSEGIELQGSFDASGYGRTFTVRYGSIDEIVAIRATVTGSSELLATYPDPRGGTAELWRFGGDDNADYLFVEFGSWTFETWDYRTNRSEARDEAIAEWVRSVTGYIPENGYPVLAGSGGLSITPVLGDQGGPDGPDLRLGGIDGTIMLYLDQCRYVTGAGFNPARSSMEWCDAPTGIRIVGFGDEDTLTSLRSELAIISLTNRSREINRTDEPYLAGGDNSFCGDDNMPEGWREQASQVGPLWLWPAGGIGGNTAVETIGILEGNQPITLRVPIGWHHQVSHLFDDSAWRSSGDYVVDPDYGAVTFLPCDKAPAQFVGGFAFTAEAHCAPFDLSGAAEGTVTISLDGEECGFSWARHTDTDNEFTITYPSDWYVAPETLTPSLGFPMTVAISTFEAPVGGDRCAQFATAAFDSIGPNDVLLTIHELGMGYAQGPRPGNFRSEAELWEGGDFVECVTNVDRLHGGQFRYFDNGRGFDAILAMGEDVSQEDEDAAWAMLSSFVPVATEPQPDFCNLPEDLTGDLLSHVPDAPSFPEKWAQAEETLPIFADPNVAAISVGADVACARIWTATTDQGESFQLISLIGGGTNAAGYVQMTTLPNRFMPNLPTYGLEGLGDVEMQQHDDGTYTGRFNGDQYIGIALDGWSLDFFVEVWDGAMSRR